MTLLLGDTGKVAYGTLKTMNIAMAAPREIALGSSILPNVEGTINQVSFTIQQTDLPTFSMDPYSVKYTAVIIASGKVGAASTNVSYRTFKNSVSTFTSSTNSHTATQYWTQNHFRWFDVAIGDTIEVRLWSNQTDTTLDYCALMIYPTQLYPSKPSLFLKDVDIPNTSALTTLTGAGVRTTIINTNAQNSYYVSSTGSVGVPNATAVYFYGVMPHPTLGFLRVTNGDTGLLTNGLTHATQINYQRSAFPAQISFREVLR
jgi:hypothetical protein